MTSQPETRAGLGALRIDGTDTGHFYGVRWLPAERVAAFVRLTDGSGLTHPADKGDCYAVLDIYDEAGDIVDDRHVLTEADWNALNSELGLEVETVE